MLVTDNTVHIDILERERGHVTAHLYVEGIEDSGGRINLAAGRTDGSWWVELVTGTDYEVIRSTTLEGLARRTLRRLAIPVAKSTLGIEDEVRNTEKVIEL